MISCILGPQGLYFPSQPSWSQNKREGEGEGGTTKEPILSLAASIIKQQHLVPLGTALARLTSLVIQGQVIDVPPRMWRGGGRLLSNSPYLLDETRAIERLNMSEHLHCARPAKLHEELGFVLSGMHRAGWKRRVNQGGGVGCHPRISSGEITAG